MAKQDALDALNEIGKREHPNVEHHRSGGLGHLEGDESRSVVGFMPTHVLPKYRGNEIRSQETVDSIAKDIKSGKGITNPLRVTYDHKNGWGYLGEGNHRLQAAVDAGAQTVPVTIDRGNAEYAKKQGVGAPLTLKTDLNAGHFDKDYIPSNMHPHHFLKEHKTAVKIGDYKHDPDATWYHGTTKRFDQFDKNRGKSNSAHWNNLLGHHFTTKPEVADEFAHPAGSRAKGRVIPVKLDMHNPKVYQSERDMDIETMHAEKHNTYSKYPDRPRMTGIGGRERMAWDAEDALHKGTAPEDIDEHSRHAWLSHHPDRVNIANRFVTRQKVQGHDGAVYGNAVEHEGHACAIPFDEKQIQIQHTQKAASAEAEPTHHFDHNYQAYGHALYGSGQTGTGSVHVEDEYGSPAGELHYSTWNTDHPEHPQAIHISHVEVDPEHRRSGLASRMYAVVKAAHPDHIIPASHSLTPAGKKLTDRLRAVDPKTHDYKWTPSMQVKGSMIDEYRTDRWHQDCRVQQHTHFDISRTNTEEVKGFFGHGDAPQADHVEKQITFKDYLKQHRKERPEDAQGHPGSSSSERAKGYDLGVTHALDPEHADFAEMDRQHSKSLHPEHFFRGYSDGFRNTVPEGER